MNDHAFLKIYEGFPSFSYFGLSYSTWCRNYWMKIPSLGLRSKKRTNPKRTQAKMMSLLCLVLEKCSRCIKPLDRISSSIEPDTLVRPCLCRPYGRFKSVTSKRQRNCLELKHEAFLLETDVFVDMHFFNLKAKAFHLSTQPKQICRYCFRLLNL